MKPQAVSARNMVGFLLVASVLLSCAETQLLEQPSPNDIGSRSVTVKECVALCVGCVQLFSKELYDGRRCVYSCHLTRGKSSDEFCRNKLFQLIR